MFIDSGPSGLESQQQQSRDSSVGRLCGARDPGEGRQGEKLCWRPDARGRESGVETLQREAILNRPVRSVIETLPGWVGTEACTASFQC